MVSIRGDGECLKGRGEVGGRRMGRGEVVGGRGVLRGWRLVGV